MKLGFGITTIQAVIATMLATAIGAVTWGGNLLGSSDSNQVATSLGAPGSTLPVNADALTFATPTAGSGWLRFGTTADAIKFRSDGGADLRALTFGSNGITLGDASAGTITLQGGTSLAFYVGASQKALIDTNGLSVFDASGNIAPSGHLRFGKVPSIRAMNNAGDGPLNLVSTNASDQIQVGGTLNAGVLIGSSTAGAVTFQINGVERARVDNSGVTIPTMTAGRVVTVGTGGLLTDSTAASLITLSLGATPATGAGQLRLTGGAVTSIAFRNNMNSADINLVTTDTANNVFFGSTSIPGTYISSQTSLTAFQFGSAGLIYGVSLPSSHVRISQATSATNGATGARMLIQAQICSGTTSTGGDLELATGTGTSANGQLRITNVGTTSTATAGAASLPANPEGFVTVVINGTSRKLPYYAT